MCRAVKQKQSLRVAELRWRLDTSPGFGRGESAASCVGALLDAAVASWDALRPIPPPPPSSASGGALPSRKAEPAGAGADARCASPAGRENPLASAMGSANKSLLTPTLSRSDVNAAPRECRRAQVTFGGIVAARGLPQKAAGRGDTCPA